MHAAISVAMMFVRGAAVIGWIFLLAADTHTIPVTIEGCLHSAIVGLLVVASLGVIQQHFGRRKTDRGYAEGVVDGMKLTAANDEPPAPRMGPGAQVVYMQTWRTADPCTRRAPKTIGARSS